jgi:flavin-dependent dehydrogenase
MAPYSTFAKDIAGLQTEDAHNAFGIRAYYKGVQNMDTQNFIELHFVDELLPGYFWIFPLPNGEANVGAGITSRPSKSEKNKPQTSYRIYCSTSSRF